MSGIFIYYFNVSLLGEKRKKKMLTLRKVCVVGFHFHKKSRYAIYHIAKRQFLYLF